MLDHALSTLKETEKPIVHSVRGYHYRWPGWIKRMENKMFYGNSWAGVTIDGFIEQLNECIRWYGEKRIKLSLRGMSPLDYRK